MFGCGVRGNVFDARARLVALHILQLGLGGFDMRRAALAICLLVTPAFGEAQLDYAIDQYTQCTRRAYLAEAAGPQFIADRNVTTAAECAMFACPLFSSAPSQSLQRPPPAECGWQNPESDIAHSMRVSAPRLRR